MQAIGKKISALRKERDMTQVDLADKLGVTYQAVSSWERGNSMPDIAKLPDISQVLAVSIDELLDNAKATTIVKNVLSGQETSSIIPDLETLVDVAPILKPSQVNTLAKQANSAKSDTNITITGDMLVQLAQHMDSENLKEIILQSDNIENSAIIEIACYMDSQDLKEIILHCDKITGEAITEIICHMDCEDLKEIILHCDKITGEAMTEIACHMDSEDLKEVILHCDKITGETITEIACHMDSEDLKEIIMQRKNTDKKH
jgi:transcriptional regulator with XRE-family HTH domain